MDAPSANSDTAASGAGWSRMKAVFLAALDRPAGERTAFVAGACGGDDALRREVESLLASDEAATGFCETPAVALLGGPGAAPAAVVRRLATGSRLGVYEVTGFLGAGGMGEVPRP
jgi:eukaryotic-like serine/threonine-protein kinase